MAERTREGEESFLQVGRLERSLCVTEDEVLCCDPVISPSSLSQPSLPSSLGFCGCYPV